MLLVWSTLLLTIQLFGNDELQIRGRVLSAVDRQPLAGAQVSLPDLKIGTATDAEGLFNLTIPAPGSYEILVEFLGYRSKIISAELNHSLILEVMLREQPLSGETVQVVDRQDLRQLDPQSLTVMSMTDIHRSGAQTIGEMLADLPGVTALQTGPAISKPVIRGVHSQRVLIINAGVAQEGQQWGGDHGPEIDPFAPARIEVLRGAAGVKYGAGAIGGVIRTDPPQVPEKPGSAGVLSLNGFSNNRQGAAALNLEGFNPVFSGIGWRLQGSLRKAGDSRAPDYYIENSAFKEANWSAALQRLSGNNKTRLYYSHFNSELGIFRGAHIGNLSDLLRAIERGEPRNISDFSYQIAAPRQEVSHRLLSVNSRQQLGQAGTLTLQYGWQQNRRQEFDAHRGFGGDPPAGAAFDLELTTYSGDLSFRHRPLGNWYGEMGVSALRQTNARLSSGYLIPNFRQYGLGAFWLENWSAGNWTVNMGSRYDYRRLRTFLSENQSLSEVLREFSHLTLVGGVIYRISAGWSLGGNIGSGWRPPSVNELYSDGVHHGTAQYERGNAALTGESSLGSDITLKFLGRRSEMEVSIYHNGYRNFIFLFPEAEPILTIRGAFPAFSYRQADARIYGVDGYWHWQLLPFYRLKFSASLVRGDNRNTGQPLFLMPADRLTIAQHFHHLPLPEFFSDTFFEISATLVDRQERFPAGVDYSDPPAGYGLLNANFGTRIHIGRQPLDIGLGGNNLLNKRVRDYLSRFRYYIDDPGRSIVLRLRLAFGAPGEH